MSSDEWTAEWVSSFSEPQNYVQFFLTKNKSQHLWSYSGLTETASLSGSPEIWYLKLHRKFRRTKAEDHEPVGKTAREQRPQSLMVALLFFFFFNFDCTGSSLQYAGSLVVLGGFSYPVEYGILGSPPRDWTCVPCIGRWILNHWTTMKVSLMVLLVSTWESPEFNDFEKSIVLNLCHFSFSYPAKYNLINIVLSSYAFYSFYIKRYGKNWEGKNTSCTIFSLCTFLNVVQIPHNPKLHFIP